MGLTWIASSSATSYHVKRSTVSGGPYTQAGSASTTNYSDNGARERHKLLLCGFRSERVRREPGFEPGLRYPGFVRSGSADSGNAQRPLWRRGEISKSALTWTASSGATSYHVKRATTSGGPYTQVGAPTSTSFTNTGLTNGTTYFYVVSALNATGESANSSQASATPVAAPATADVTITVDPTKTKPISPWIYGLNFYTGVSGAPPRLTLDRAGGNRWTAYNWETNASNAGSDFQYENDSFPDLKRYSS